MAMRTPYRHHQFVPLWRHPDGKILLFLQRWDKTIKILTKPGLIGISTGHLILQIWWRLATLERKIGQLRNGRNN
jgi:hypothetical protein